MERSDVKNLHGSIPGGQSPNLRNHLTGTLFSLLRGPVLLVILLLRRLLLPSHGLLNRSHALPTNIGYNLL